MSCQGRVQDDFWRGSVWSNTQDLYTYSTHSERQAQANSVDPDQTPAERGVWSESTLFATHPAILLTHK